MFAQLVRHFELPGEEKKTVDYVILHLCDKVGTKASLGIWCSSFATFISLCSKIGDKKVGMYYIYSSPISWPINFHFLPVWSTWARWEMISIMVPLYLSVMIKIGWQDCHTLLSSQLLVVYDFFCQRLQYLLDKSRLRRIIRWDEDGKINGKVGSSCRLRHFWDT